MAVNIPSESTLKRNFQRLQAGNQAGAAPGASQANPQQQRRSQQPQQTGGPGVRYLPAVPPAQHPGPIVLPARQPQLQVQQPRQDGRLQRERVRITILVSLSDTSKQSGTLVSCTDCSEFLAASVCRNDQVPLGQDFHS